MNAACILPEKAGSIEKNEKGNISAQFMNRAGNHSGTEEANTMKSITEILDNSNRMIDRIRCSFDRPQALCAGKALSRQGESELFMFRFESVMKQDD